MKSSILGRSLGYADLARHSRRLHHDDENVRDRARLHLAERMGKLRGLPQKIGQILSQSDDLELAESFAPTRDGAEPLEFDVIESLIVEQWKRPLREVVADIEPVGKAASLGQVHRARLHDGQEVAIKVQYPGIREAIASDLKLLGWLSIPVGDLRRGFDLQGYRTEILADLEEELDYECEARHQERFRDMHKETGWIIPSVHRELSTQTVLTSQWVDGYSIQEAANFPSDVRDLLGRRLLAGTFESLFGHGACHADPHPGNYRFTIQGEIVLYDYGSVREVDRNTRAALLTLIEQTGKREGDPFEAFLALGFDRDLLTPLREKLPALSLILFAPWVSPTKFDLGSWNRTQRLQDVLGEDRWNFRFAGPPSMIFFLRAMRGLLYYLERLGCPQAWSVALRPYWDRFASQLESLRKVCRDSKQRGFDRLARELKVEVREGGSQLVALSFPAISIERLDQLMGEELVERIRAQGIDIESLVSMARATSYAPSEVFTYEEPSGRTVRVWLD